VDVPVDGAVGGAQHGLRGAGRVGGGDARHDGDPTPEPLRQRLAGVDRPSAAETETTSASRAASSLARRAISSSVISPSMRRNGAPAKAGAIPARSVS